MQITTNTERAEAFLEIVNLAATYTPKVVEAKDKIQAMSDEDGEIEFQKLNESMPTIDLDYFMDGAIRDATLNFVAQNNRADYAQTLTAIIGKTLDSLDEPVEALPYAAGVGASILFMYQQFDSADDYCRNTVLRLVRSRKLSGLESLPDNIKTVMAGLAAPNDYLREMASDMFREVYVKFENPDEFWAQFEPELSDEDIPNE